MIKNTYLGGLPLNFRRWIAKHGIEEEIETIYRKKRKQNVRENNQQRYLQFDRGVETEDRVPAHERYFAH